MARTVTTPHLAALVTALAAHRGTIEGRVPVAATTAVADELRTLAGREDEVVRALLRAADLPIDAVETRSSRTPAAAVAAVSGSLAPLDQTLLADIGVSRGLADRAHLAHLAVAHEDGATARDLADALHEVEDFFREWAEWQLAAAGEIAAGGVARLQPTAVQRAAEHARQIAALPAKAGREVTGRANALVGEIATTAAEQARTAVSEVAGSVTTVAAATTSAAERARNELAGQATKVARVADAAWTAGRDAALRDADHEAQATGATTTAEVVHETRAELGVLDADELPIRGYDALTVPEVVAALARVTDPKDVRTLDAYEKQHKNRKTVVEALQERSTELVSA